MKCRSLLIMYHSTSFWSDLEILIKHQNRNAQWIIKDWKTCQQLRTSVSPLLRRTAGGWQSLIHLGLSILNTWWLSACHSGSSKQFLIHLQYPITLVTNTKDLTILKDQPNHFVSTMKQFWMTLCICRHDH